jgi:hypothetical protein
MSAREHAPLANADGPYPPAPEAGQPSGTRQPTAARRQSLSGMAVDVLAPVGLYYGLRAAGVGVWLALVAGSAPPALSSLVGLLAGRRRDGLGLSVMALLLLSSGVSLLAGSPRVLLARDGLLTGTWAIWFFLSLRARRPVTFAFSRPLLEGRRVFDPVTRRWVPRGPDSWDALWEHVPEFRRIWRVVTVIWGLALLADAVIRLLMAWMLPVSVVPGLGGALWPVTFVILQVITNVYFARSGFWLILRGRGRPPA